MSKTYYDLDAKERGKLVMALIREPRSQARSEGGRAFDNGKGRDENPYDFDTQRPEFSSWDAGWSDERQMAS